MELKYPLTTADKFEVCSYRIEGERWVICLKNRPCEVLQIGSVYVPISANTADARIHIMNEGKPMHQRTINTTKVISQSSIYSTLGAIAAILWYRGYISRG